MKSLINSHKELVLILVQTTTRAIEVSCPKGYFLHFESQNEEYVFRFMQSAVLSEKGVEQRAIEINRVYINKGDYQMNDIRLGITANYLFDVLRDFITTSIKMLEEPKKASHQEPVGVSETGYSGENPPPPSFTISQDRAGDNRWATWLSIGSETYSQFESRLSMEGNLIAFSESPQQSAQEFLKLMRDSKQYKIVKA